VDSGYNQTSFAKLIRVDKSTVSNWLNGSEPSESSFEKAIDEVTVWSEKRNHIRIFDEICDELSLLGFTIASQRISHCRVSMSTLKERIKYIRDNYDETSLLENFDMKLLVDYITDYYLKPLHPYITTVSNIEISSDFSLIENNPRNYLIIRIREYAVMIVLSKHTISDAEILKHNESIATLKDELKNKVKIKMLIIFSDKPADIASQDMLLKQHNLFYETITSSEFMSVRHMDLTISSLINTVEQIDTIKYAKMIINRLQQYLVLIKDEIAFSRQFTKEDTDKKEEVKKHDATGEYFVKKRLMKDFLELPYLSRHAIYFEQNRLKDFIGDRRLELVVELSWTNAILSFSIHKQCERIILCSSSQNAYKFFEDHRAFIPNNVTQRKTQIQPDYLTSNFHDLANNVDLVIMGFAYGSQITELREYMRSITNLLKPDGSLMVSFLNSQSVMYMHNRRESDDKHTATFGPSTYMRYRFYDQESFLFPIKRYNPDEAANEVLRNFSKVKYYTYPFLSALAPKDEQRDTRFNKEIRNIDKLYALGEIAYNTGSTDKNGKKESPLLSMGHYITVLGSGLPTKENAATLRALVHSKLNGIDDKESISLPFTTHTVGMKNALLIKGQILNNSEIVKTVLLVQKKENKVKKLERVKTICVITTINTNLLLNRSNGWRFLPEKEVVSVCDTGSISPFLYLMSEKFHFNEKYYYNLPTNKQNVFFSSGMNNEAFKIQMKDFVFLLKNDGVQDLAMSTGIIEL